MAVKGKVRTWKHADKIATDEAAIGFLVACAGHAHDAIELAALGVLHRHPFVVAEMAELASTGHGSGGSLSHLLIQGASRVASVGGARMADPQTNGSGGDVVLSTRDWLQSRSNEFQRCWPWLDASIARFGRTHEKQHVWHEIANQTVFLFSEQRCVAAVRVTTWPTGLKDLQVWLVGGNMRDIREVLYPRIEAWGTKIGCHRMIAYGRRGWLRLLEGWFALGTTRVKSLMGKQPTEVEIRTLGYHQLEEQEEA